MTEKHEQFYIEYANNPVRKNASCIDLNVKFYGLPSPVPFTATPDDIEEHGRLLYANAVNGDYGPVS